RIANKLGRLIKAHRLAIEDRTAKYPGMMPLDPRTGIHQMRETGGVACGKTIFAKTFDLAETSFSEFGRVSVADHPVDDLLTKFLYVARISPCGHRPAQLIRFFRGESSGHH